MNGFWASLGPGTPNCAYSMAKFAVRGFSEVLIEDLRVHAPQVRVAVAMPGHAGTDIIANSIRARGLPEPEHMSDAQVEELIPRDTQAKLICAGVLAEDAATDGSAPDARAGERRLPGQGRCSARRGGATIILDGVRSGTWRILVGEDAKKIDVAVRAKPEAAYDYADLFSALARQPAAEPP